MKHPRTSQLLVGLFALTLVAGTFLAEPLRSRVQALVSMTGQGNEQVVLAADGWMYFRPALEHVWGQPMVEARPAISHFHEELLRAGIELVVVPVPVKVSVDGAALGVRGNPVNAGWDDFFTELRRYRIPHVDVLSLLAERDGPHFLKTDSHWTPESMDAVAAAVADTLHDLGLPTRKKRPRNAVIVAAHGDLVDLLGAGSEGFEADRVTTRSLATPLGDTRGAPILLIGDSYANIFADPALGFGGDAGMQAALVHHLGVDVDALLQNDGGASKSRIALADDPGRLDETLVVVWVFTARELSFGEWISTPLHLDAPPQIASPYFAIEEGGEPFSGVIIAMGEVPDPAAATYADHVITLRVRASGGREGFVRAWSMRDRVLTEMASLSAGSVLQGTLIPWSQAPAPAQSASRSELSDRPRGAPVGWVVP